ncbi:hypothetical protein F441_10924, partial [Phytophthora nicotianae CJ01A1]
MVGRTPTEALSLAGMITASLVTADIPIVVFHDATYSLPESYGVPCSGVEAEPVGTACPKAGDVAVTDCQPYLLSYNGAVCVAPVDAECVRGHDDVWSCEFPKTGYTSAIEAETIAAYVGDALGWDMEHKEPQGTNQEKVSKTAIEYPANTRKLSATGQENLVADTDADEVPETGTVKPCHQTEPPTESTTIAPTEVPCDPTDAPTEST